MTYRRCGYRDEITGGYTSGTFSAAGARYLWGEYVSGNSDGSVGVCRLAADNKTVEWCCSLQFLAIEGRGTARAPDETWQARANGDSSVAPLELFDLVNVRRSTLDELPNLVSPSPSRLLLLRWRS